MEQNALEVKGLTHRYGKHLALDDLSFKVGEGRICGLLGRNGAGKSTLINILIAGQRQTGGQALVFGEGTFENASALSKLCVVREKGLFPPQLRIKDALKTCNELYANWDTGYALELVDKFQLNIKKRYKQLSRGMESSLGLIIGLASRAPLTVFDEPSLGLDAVARETFYSELIRDNDAHPRTVIISTHLIDEVTRVFQEVVIIDKGKLLVQSGVHELLQTAVTVTGDEERVKQLTKGYRLLHEERLSTLYQAAVRLENGAQVEPEDGITVEPLPLQRLFVYLTEGGDHQ